MRKTIISLFMVLFLVAILVCGGLLYHGLQSDSAADTAADEIQAQRITEPDGELLDFELLRAEFPDIIAWLSIPGTDIDYPVVQAEDNEFYLQRDAQQQQNKNGALFLDYRVHSDFSDFSSVIYGHHMKSGRMFQNLVKFKDKAFFAEHREAVMHVPGGVYRMEIFAVAVVPHDSPLYGYVFASPAEEAKQLELLQEKAMFYRETEFAADDRLVLLSTCSYEFQNARTIVACRLAIA